MKKLLILTFAFCLFTFGLMAQSYYLVENNEITLNGLPTSYTSIDGTYWFKNYRTAAGETVWYSDGFRIGVTPEYDAETQRLGQRYYDIGNDVVTWYVIDKSEAEIAAQKEALLSQLDNQLDVAKIKYLLQLLVEPIIETIELDTANISALTSIYKQWRVNYAYAANDIVVSDSSLYRVVQAHTSQNDWLPANTPALYTRFTPAGTVAEWVQPTGAQDAYNTGDRVLFNGSTYESLINANVWSPTAYPAGWQLVE